MVVFRAPRREASAAPRHRGPCPSAGHEPPSCPRQPRRRRHDPPSAKSALSLFFLSFRERGRKCGAPGLPGCERIWECPASSGLGLAWFTTRSGKGASAVGCLRSQTRAFPTWTRTGAAFPYPVQRTPPPPKKMMQHFRGKKPGLGPSWANGEREEREEREGPRQLWRGGTSGVREGGREGWTLVFTQERKKRTWRAESGGRRRKKQKEFIILAFKSRGPGGWAPPRALLILTCALATERSVLTSCFRWWAVRRTP